VLVVLDVTLLEARVVEFWASPLLRPPLPRYVRLEVVLLLLEGSTRCCVDSSRLEE